MTIEKCTKPSFTVIGKEGSTAEGSGFIQKLWEDANAHFGEIEHLAKRDDSGNLCGVWGAEAPDGWTKWVIPAFEYLVVECNGLDTFPEMISYLKQNDITLAGAAHDFTNPQTGKNYMFFPVKRL